jgi:enterochelin esterase-like enzyme
MQMTGATTIVQQNHIIFSKFLDREVKVDAYFPKKVSRLKELSLLLINDGQDLRKMHFKNILKELYKANKIAPMLFIGIHCGPDRGEEYATAKILDYKGRGTKAAAYTDFIFQELLPFIKEIFSTHSFKEKSLCGFSLGALSALDIVWNHPEEFTKAGLFSGAFWWRLVGQDDASFDERQHRIMHKQIREGGFYPWLKFFFENGTLDETADRNNNGVIDAIDDTMTLIDELVLKGYDRQNDIKYLEIEGGTHNVETWAKAFPVFLEWGWGRSK